MAKKSTLPKLPPRHPVIAPIQPDAAPDQPKPPTAPGPTPKKNTGKRERTRRTR